MLGGSYCASQLQTVRFQKMKRAIITINILAALFAAGTIYKITTSGYSEAALSSEKAQFYKEKIKNFKSMEKLQEFSTHGVDYQESLSSTLNQGMGLFKKSNFLFLGLALLNVLIMVMPKKET